VAAARPGQGGGPLALSLVAAAVALGWAVGLPRVVSPAPQRRETAPRSWPPVLLALCGTTVAGVALAMALARFRGPAMAHGGAWTLYVAALAALTACFLPWRGTHQVAVPPIRSRELRGLAVVLALGAAFRLHRLATTPYGVWYDEAQNGLEALRILHESDYRPVFVAGASQMPALFFYYVAPFVRLLGAGVLSVRVATTLVGLAAIVVVWLLGRETFGPRTGLIAAALLAASRWHVTFSRFGVAHVFMTACAPLVLLLFLRSQDRRSLREALLCGLALGLGLQLYYAMVAVPLVMACVFLLRVARGTSRGWAPAGLFALTAAAAAVSYAPVMDYASRHGQEFSRRMRTVSLIKVGTRQEVAALLREDSSRRQFLDTVGASVRKHARMFHLEGDANGRHNLPGAPMLDPVSGLFFTIGLVWCLAHPFEPRRALLLLWFGTMMAAGVLSLDFEAPQGARTLGVTPVLTLLAAIPLAQLSQALDRSWLGPPSLHPGVAAVGIALAAATVSSWHTYFHRQVWDPATWAAFSTPETKIAEVVRAEGRGADVYVPPTFLGGPTEAFILGRPLEARPFERGRDLPLEPRGRPAIAFVDATDVETVRLLRRNYPHASLEPFGPPRRDGSQGDPVLWIARVPSDEVDALRGWTARFFQNGRPQGERATLTAGWDWRAVPLAPPFAVRVEGVLRVVDDGTYRLVLASEDPAILMVDGEAVVGGVGRKEGIALLARGRHQVLLKTAVRRREARTELRWSGPGIDGETPIPSDRMFLPQVGAGGLLGRYQKTARPEETAALLRIDPQVSFYFHFLPLPRPFFVRWSGSLYAAADGAYQIGTSSIDSSAVWIDGTQVVANALPNQYVQGDVSLGRGWHAIEVTYEAVHDYSQVYLYWTPPHGEREVVPAEALRPPGPRSLRPAARDEPPPPPAGDDLAHLAPASPPRPGPVSLDARTPHVTRTYPAVAGALRLARGPQDRLYVLDSTARRLMKWTPNGGWAAFAETRPGADFVDASDLEVDRDGRLYVLDAAGTIRVFSSGGRLQRSIDLHPLAVYNPRGFAVTRTGGLVLADTGGGRVLVCDAEGKMVRQIGRLGRGRGELVDPMDVAEDGMGGIVVVDAGNARVQRFAPDGRPTGVWLRPGSPTGFQAPRAESDSDGNVWIAGGDNDEIWKIRPGESGDVRAFPGSPGVRVVALAAGKDQLFLLAQSPPRVLEVRLPADR
jgi:4-amino-4-deoxy-L-arabinose transferase-like glycosyltransferase